MVTATPQQRPSFATQSDVAREVGVSLMTVQRALSGHRYVAEATRLRIEQAAQRMGYRPNTAARSTRTGRTGCIALLLSTLGTRSITSGATLDGIQEALRSRDLHLLIEAMPDAQLTDAGFVPKMLRQLTSDGLLINYNAQIPQAMIDLLGLADLPLVWLNSKQEADCVYPDDFGAARTLTAELIAMGHRRIDFVDFTHSLVEPAWHYSGVDRHAGYADAMREAGLTPRRRGSREEFETGLALDAAMAMLRRDDRPTAVVGYVGRESRIMHTAARLIGLSVPGDLSIASFDIRVDQEMGLSTTTMLVPDVQVGRLGAEMLLDKLDDAGGTCPPVAVAFAFHLGQTCAGGIRP